MRLTHYNEIEHGEHFACGQERQREEQLVAADRVQSESREDCSGTEVLWAPTLRSKEARRPLLSHVCLKGKQLGRVGPSRTLGKGRYCQWHKGRGNKRLTPGMTFCHAVVVLAAAELDASSYNVSRVGGRGSRARKEGERPSPARSVLPSSPVAYLFISTGVRGA